MNYINQMKLNFPAKSCNESFSRSAVAAFLMQLDPTISELNDVKTAVSEAVTNAIIHGYKHQGGEVYISAFVTKDKLFTVKIRDKGCGIEDIKKAMEPLFTTGSEERAGLGFAVMQSFMDSISVRSKVGKGTVVTMKKQISDYDA